MALLNISEKFRFAYVPIGSVAVHDKVPNEVLRSLATVTHTLGADQLLSIEAIELILHHHPIHTVSERDSFFAVSGLRSYQLAKHFLPESEKVPIILQSSQVAVDPTTQSAADLYLSHLVFGLDFSARKVDLTHLSHQVDQNLKKASTFAKTRSSPKKLEFKYVPRTALTMHDDIPDEVLTSLATIEHALGADQILSTEALKLLLLHHPIQAISDGDLVNVISGLRTYQLVKNRLREFDQLPVILHQIKGEFDIPTLSAADTYFSCLVFGLDFPAWDLDLTRLWQTVDGNLKRTLTPQLKSKIGLAKLLGRNRRHLSPKVAACTSVLKATLGRQTATQEVS